MAADATLLLACPSYFDALLSTFPLGPSVTNRATVAAVDFLCSRVR